MRRAPKAGKAAAANIFDDIQAQNRISPIKIRTKPTAAGDFKVYLDWYRVELGRKTYFLNHFLTGTQSALNADRQILKQVIQDRNHLEASQRQTEAGGIHSQVNFLAYLKAYKEKHFEKNLQSVIKHWAAFVTNTKYGTMTISDVSKKDVQTFINYLQTIGLHPNTIKTYMAALSSVFGRLVKKDVLVKNPVSGTDRPKVVKRAVKYLSLEELDRLLKTPYESKWDITTAFEFSINTGLRRSDVISLTFENIKEGFIILQQCKTNEPVRIPVNDKAANIIALQASRRGTVGKVFLLPSGYNFNKYLKIWGELAGIENLTSHLARHTTAVLMLTNGATLYTASKVLGHKSTVTTEQFYGDIAATAAKAAVDSIKY